MSDRASVVPFQKPSQTRVVAMNAERPSETWLTAQIVGMLSIYPRRDEGEGVTRIALAMWVDCLSDLPQEAIERAIRHRLQSSSRWSPVPGEIRALALGFVACPNPPEKPLPFGPGHPLSEAERRLVIDRLTELSRELGGVEVPKMREGSVDAIVKVAARVCGVTSKDVRSVRRTADLTMAKFLACHAARRHTNASWAEIGAALCKDHSTIIHACAEAEKRIASDPAWAEAHAEIERRLSA